MPLAGAAVVFALGVVALAVVFARYLTGQHDLPLWLNVSAGTLIPAGLGLSLIALFADARSARRSQPSGTGAVSDTASATQSANSVRSAKTTPAPAARN